MSSLRMRDKRLLEEFLEMGAGYVLDFSDRTFGEFCEEAVDVDIHSDKYLTHGSSKANKLQAFWEIESDYLAGQIRRMQDSVEKDPGLAINRPDDRGGFSILVTPPSCAYRRGYR